MGLKSGRLIHRFLAALTILSFTLTQSVPSWALRADPSDSLRAGLEGTTERELASSLEELRKESVSAEKPAPAAITLIPGGREIGILHATREAFVEKGDCGCFARVGKPQREGGLPTNDMVITAAKALEPRGYQSASAGVITLGHSAQFEVRKVLGAVDQLKELMDGHPLPDGNVQLVHLRWPTQGEPSEDNQHPTIEEEGKTAPSEVILIFNGDITNYRELDRFLAEQGIARPAHVTTDAWTITALIWHYFRKPSEVQIFQRARELHRQEGATPGRDEQRWVRVEVEEGLRQEGVHMSLLDAVAFAYGRLEGDFAFIVASVKEPDKVIGALKGQKPLVIGRGKTPGVGNFIGSEASTFIDHTDLNQSLMSGDIVVVREDGVNFYRRVEERPGHFGLKEVPEGERPIELLDVEEVKPTKIHRGVEYPTYTRKEIAEQPDAIRRTLEYQGRLNVLRARLAGSMEPMPGLNLTDEEIRKATGVLVLAMGTATHAGLASAPYFLEDVGLSAETVFDMDVQTATTLFDILRGRILRLVRKSGPAVKVPTDSEGWAALIQEHKDGALRPLVKYYKGIIGIAISQSGNTMDTNQTVILLQALGVRFIGVVNKPIETPLIRLTKGDGGLFRTRAGAEIGVASTKAFVSQIAALRLLAIYFGLVRGTISSDEARTKLENLLHLPDQVEEWLSNAENRKQILRIAKMLAGQQTLMFLARGAEVPVAMEGGLKMLELAYLFTIGMDSALMKHGYIAHFPESKDPLVRRYALAILTDRASFADALNNLSEIRARYGRVVAVTFKSDVEKVRPNADEIIVIPDVAEELAAVVAVLPLQLLAAETTDVVNDTGRMLASWAEHLYWQLRQRETATRVVSDAEFLSTLRTIENGFGELSDSGRLELLPTAKVRQVRLLIHGAVESGQKGSANVMEEESREVIRVLRGPALSMIMFFDHELARFGHADAGDTSVLTAQEREGVTKVFQRHPFYDTPNPSQILARVSQDLAVFYSQSVSRGSNMKARWKDWRYDKGLGEFMGRDMDKPRGLAKEVTVDRLEERLRRRLAELGVPPGQIETAFRGVQRLVGSRIQEYPGVVKVIAGIVGVPEGTLRRWAMQHEQAHFLVRQMPSYPLLLGEVEWAITQGEIREVERKKARFIPFRIRFEKEFGAFESDAEYLDEVLTKYLSARITGVGKELFKGIEPEMEQLLGRAILPWTEEIRERLAKQIDIPAETLQESGELPRTLAELFDTRHLPKYARRRGILSSPEVVKARQLAYISRAFGLDPAIEFEDLSDTDSMEIQRLLQELGHASRAEAPILMTGLEETDFVLFEMNAKSMDTQVRFAPRETYENEDVQNDWTALQPVEAALKGLGAPFAVRYGEPTGMQWTLRQPTGSDYRRHFQISREGGNALSLVPAYRIHGAGTPQWMILATLSESGKPRRYWAIPSDQNLAGRLTALIQNFLQGTPIPAAEPSPGAPPPVRVAPWPAPLQRIRERVEELIGRFENDPRVDLIAEPAPGENQTTLVIVGGKRETGLLETLAGPIAMAKINISDHGPYDTDDVGLSYLVVDVPLEELGKRLDVFGDRSVLEEIEYRIGRRYPSQTEVELHGQLASRELTSREIELLMREYRQYHGVPRVRVEGEEGATTLLGIAPYEHPLPDIDRPLAEVLARHAEEEARAKGMPALPQVVPSSIFIHEFNKPHPLVLVLLTLPLPQQRIIDLGVYDAFENFLSHLSQVPQTGLEEKPPVLELRGASLRVREAGVIRGESVQNTIRHQNGAHFAAEGGGSRIELADGVLIESNAVLVAPQGQVIRVGRESLVMAGAQIWGNATLGANVKFSGTIDAVKPGTDVLIGDGTGFARGSTTVVSGSVLVPAKILVGQPDGLVGEQVLPVNVVQAKAITNSLVVGSPVYQGALLLNSIVYLGTMGNDVYLSRSALYGASPENRTAVAHFNELISLYAIPVPYLLDLSSSDERAKLQERLTAMRLGTLFQRTLEALVPGGHPTRPREVSTYLLADKTVEGEFQGTNFGDKADVSNFDPRHDGTKGPSIVWGGAAFGVQSVLSAPVEVGPRALVANNAVVTGREAIQPGTLVLAKPVGVDPVTGKPKPTIRPGYIDESRGRLGEGVEENIAIRLEAIRVLEVLANVAAAGAQQARSDQDQASYRKELGLLQSYLKEVTADLRAYLALVEVSARNLGQDGLAKPDNKTIQSRFGEQVKVLSLRATYEETEREATEAVARAVAAAAAAGLEEHTMANVVDFSMPTNFVELQPGTPSFDQAVQRGIERIRRGEIHFVILAAGRATRFSNSVREQSPAYEEAMRERGLLDIHGDASKLTGILGVSGIGPTPGILEGLAGVGRLAGTPVKVTVVDSVDNRQVLLNGIGQIRQEGRLDPLYLEITPGGELVDQGELPVLYKASKQPVYAWNPSTNQRDRPVTSPTGEFGAFKAAIDANVKAGEPIRDTFMIYGDQASFFGDPRAVLAFIGNAEGTDLSGLSVQKTALREPDGGIWTRVRWADGYEALAVAERSARQQGNPDYNARLEETEGNSAKVPGFFPYNAGPLLLSARVVDSLVKEGVSLKEQSKTVRVQSGPNSTDLEEIYALKQEYDITEGVQRAPEKGWSVQIQRGPSNWYRALKMFDRIGPAGEEIFRRGLEALQGMLGDRLLRNPLFVEGSPLFRGFRVGANGSLEIQGDVGVVLRPDGLYVYQHRGNYPARDPKGKFMQGPHRFSRTGFRALEPATDGVITLREPVRINEDTYWQLAAKAGLEEGLTRQQIHERLFPLLTRLAVTPVTVLAMDVDGVTTEQDGDLPPETGAVYEGFIRDVPAGRLTLLTDIGPGQLRDRVLNRLTPLVAGQTISFPLSGGAFLGHVIPEEAVGVIDRWVLAVSGETDPERAREKVLRLEAKKQEYDELIAQGKEPQISKESRDHLFDINRTEFTSGDIVGIDIELNKEWLKAQTQANQGVDPRKQWEADTQKDLRDVGIPEPIVQTLHKAGSASITWTPPKGQTLIQLAQDGRIDPAQTIFVDDSASNFKEFSNLANWPGIPVYIGAYDKSLPPNVIQVARPGEPKPANGPEIAREVVQVARAVHLLGGLNVDALATGGATQGRPPVEIALERAGLLAGLEEAAVAVPSIPAAPRIPPTAGATTTLAAPSLAVTRTAVGPEARTLTSLRELKQALNYPSAPQTKLGGVGIKAGPYDPAGIGLAASLSQVITPEGQPIPVAFIVDNADDRRILESMELPLVEIIEIGAAYLDQMVEDYEDASRLADRWLKSFGGAREIVELGTTGPVTESIEQVLLRFRVDVPVGQFVNWKEFVDAVTRAIAA